ncbi:multidrug resistance protein A [Kushneria pakistanensis]|uniref:Multidrug resistance protein A n=1 Tax=Kushneria pakistanensis TaxID=1508770 RepID=A0ABQ3FG51_9GAMM|nr:HlyD family secretion protein [Kushneria pakistanensis]GHC23106.1 multidrug resistance protein A [Kushneria pakistanensis]
MSNATDDARPRSRRPLILTVVILAIAAVAAVLLLRHQLGGSDVWTNDARFDADYVVISPQVAGDLVAVHVEDHDRVKRGDALMDIDARDYQAAVDDAEGQVAAARAELAQIEAQLAQLPAQVRRAEAQVAEDGANADYAHATAERYRRLRHNGNVSDQNAQQADANARAQQAKRRADQAELVRVRQQDGVLKAQKDSAQAALDRALAQQEKARLALSRTHITAPVDGVIAEQSARVGGWVSAGSAQLAIVPVQGIYITAHYREVDITDVAPGQPVDISVDAWPDLKLHGHVKSLAPATGTTFSPVSSNDTSGNFTKIVQRLPVRIALDPDQPGLDRLRVGLSVETTIHTEGDRQKGA